jgi:arylsulfatase A-like enzyme
MYDPDDVGAGIAPGESPHSLVKAALELDASAAPVDESKRRAMRAQYFGMVSEVDLQFGRVIDSLRSTGAWADTMVVITADHGEMLGDHGLKEKLGFFEESYHVPCIIHDPSRPAGFGTIVQAFTENIDLLPTVSDALGVQAPLQCDGRSLTVFLDGEVPERWRTSAHYEWDWRSLFIGLDPPAWPDQRFLELQNLAVLRAESAAYVHFGDGTWLCFDLLTDPTWRTATTDPAVVLPLAQEMLTWRQEHLDRTWTDMLLTPERLGRWPVSEAI